MLLYLASTMRTVNIDYTPKWTRGTPNNYIDSVTFPRVLADKVYTYRLMVDENDLGITKPYSVQSDGSQKVNFLEYNKGYGIDQAHKIRVYVVDSDTQNQYLVAEWN
ncbi:immunomodulatory protein [Pilatotrama ljubarskyi]|nr:immunomodulatory protein [Pilatotrama ljubarskyi]